jgi:long-chain fatty acid transport protein
LKLFFKNTGHHYSKTTLIMKKQLLITTSLLLSSALSFGAGYQLNLQGLRQLAMGGTGTATPWDAATIFYNPAGLSEFDHIQAYASVNAIMPSVKFVQSPGTYTAESVSQTFTPFSIYAGGPVAYLSPISVGVGIYTPFGSGLKWDDNWEGRYITQSIELQSIFIQPTISYRINDEVSVGGGVVYAIGGMNLQRAIPIVDKNGQDGKAELDGKAHGWGFNLGVQYYVSDKVQLGFNYRSQVNMKMNRGYASFTVPSSVSGMFPYTPFSTELPLPQVATIGVAYHPTELLTLQADINYTGWSAYDSLIFDYEENTASLSDTRTPRHYKNTITFRVGGNYAVSDKVSLMLGAAWDPTPVRDGFVTPDLPDANRKVFTGGLTYKPIERLTIMGALEYVNSAKRTSSFDAEGFKGTYQTTAIAPGIGVSFDF